MMPQPATPSDRRNGDRLLICILQSVSDWENSRAKISRSPDNYSIAGDGVDTCLSLERTRNKGPQVREYRQNGFRDHPIRLLLLLSHLRRCIQLAYRQRARIFPIRYSRVGRRVVLPCGAVIDVVEPDFVSAKLSYWH